MAHILLVDDEEAIVYVFKRYLEQAGHQVTAVCDPIEAVTAAASTPVDLLVTDYRMPVMSGGALIERLRRDQPALPAVIVTAYRAEAILPADNVRVLEKPLPPQALVDELERVVSR